MLIKFKDTVLNLDSIQIISKINRAHLAEGLKVDPPHYLFFYSIERMVTFDFLGEEERDKAMEKILDAYRWQRLVCDLD